MEKYKRICISSILVTVSSVLWRAFVETNVCVESIGEVSSINTNVKGKLLLIY